MVSLQILRGRSGATPSRWSRCRFTPLLEELENRVVPTLLGQSLFPADNPWNQQIAGAPVAANSAAIMNNIISRYGNGALHPDFSQDFHDSRDLYGIPINIVHGNSTPKVSVVVDGYPGESDLLQAPLPASLVIEGDLQSGPKVGVDNRGDSHLLVWDVDNNVSYEFYRASRPSENADSKWHADQESVWDMKTNAFRTLGWTSADAAGLSLLAGLVRPDEGLPTSQGGQGAIRHAIRFTLQNSIILNQFLYPASHVANAGNNNPAVQPPMGARFRLKAGVDISTLNPQARIVAQAMKDYGMIVADNGSNFYFSGASSSVDASNHTTLTWNDNDIQDAVHGLKSLHFADFEVVDTTPVVTGLSTGGGQAGASITITGQNFSGAAGHLQVLFGNTPATSFSVVDDGHVTAVVPAGAGAVDVRVRSGVTTAADSQNIKSTIFGYGVSAITTSDRFTYGTGSTPPPVVPTAPLFVDFGDAGLWQWTSTSGYQMLCSANPEGLAPSPDGSLYVDFGASGLWRWTSAGGFQQLNGLNPDGIVVGVDNSLYIDFGNNGLWRWSSAGGYQKLHSQNVEGFSAGADGYLYIDFGNSGLWRWSAAGGYQMLHSANVEGFSTGANEALFIDFGAAGLWLWTSTGGYQMLSSGNAESLAASPDGSLYVDFGPAGLWRWTSGAGFVMLHSLNVEGLVASEDGFLYIDFGVNGLWRWSSAGGYQALHTRNPENIAKR